ncbi:MAG TPA: hypothetical protein PLX76_04480 [Cyclobacteriaceae bacterium]|nr:hypothetical protein [Cyclobacteriaceae bacterium]
MHMKIFWLAFGFFISIQTTQAQLWTENFESYADGVTSGVAGGTEGGNWSSTVSGGTYSKGSTFGNRFYSYQTTGEGVWSTSPINISGTGRAIVEMNVFGVLVGAGDYIRCYYRVDGGPEILFFEQNGGVLNFSLPGSAIITGSSMQLVVRSAVGGFFSTFSFDDIVVSAIRTLYSRKSGNWNDITPGNSTWSAVGLGGGSCNCSPLTTDYLIIGNSNTVNINVAATAGGIEVRNTGTLQWTAPSIDLNIDRGILQVDAGGAINRNGQTGVQIDFDRGVITSLIVNGTITTEDIELTVADITLNISGSGSIATTGDFRLLEDDITVNNNLNGPFIIGDDLIYDQPSSGGFDNLFADNARFINNRTLTITSDIFVGNDTDDDNGFTNSAGAVLNVVNLNFNDGDFDFFNSGTINQSGNFSGISTGDTNVDNLAGGVWNWTLTPNTTFDANIATVMNLTAVSNTFNYSAAGAQRIIPTSYNNITLSNSGAKDANNASFSVSGNWLVSGTATFTEGTGTVTLNGTTAQTITNPAGETFNNLVVNNSFATSPQVTLANNITVSTVLTMTDGNINLNGNTLALTAATGALSKSLSSTSGWAYGGSFRRAFPTTAIAIGTVDGYYPLGSATDYRPFFVGKNGVASSNGTITVSHTNSTSTSIVNINDGGGNFIVRRHDSFWTPVTSGMSAGTWSVRAGGTNFGVIASNAHLRMPTSAGVVGTHGAGSGGPTEWYVNRTGLSVANLSNNFHVGSTNATNSPLPIQLLSFDALPEKESVKLNWSTASELNNDFFTIEKSRDGESFDEVSQVAGQGTTNAQSKYVSYDDEPWIGKTYYRLKQTDYDGTYTYSNLVLVVFDESPGLQVFPNPATDKYFKILIKGLTPNQQVEVSLTDSRGVLVYGYSETSNEGGKVEITVDMTEKPAGMYLIRVVGSILPASKVIVN